MKEISSIPVSLGKAYFRFASEICFMSGNWNHKLGMISKGKFFLKLRDLYISMISKFLTCYFFKKSDIVLKVDQRHFSRALRKNSPFFSSFPKSSQEVKSLLKYKPQKNSLNKRVQKPKVEINYMYCIVMATTSRPKIF